MPPHALRKAAGRRSGQLLLDLHAVRLRLGLIDLVHRHDDRHVRRLRVVDRLQRLRHHAVVRSHYDHDDVGDLGAACTHAGKGLVTRCIEEHNLASKRRRIRLRDLHLVRADVLRNATGLARRHIRRTDRVQQRSLAVVDVAHDRHDWRARNLHHARRVFQEALDRLVLQLLFHADHGRVRAKLPRHVLHQVRIQRLVHRHEHALHQQRRNQVLAAHIQLLGQVLHADAFGHRNRLGNRQRLVREHRPAIPRRRLEALHRAFLHLLVALTAAPLSRPCRRPHTRRRLARSRSNAQSTWPRAKPWPRSRRKARTRWSTRTARRTRRERPRRMHRTPRARSHRRRRPRTRSAGCLRTWPLKDRSAALNAGRRGARRRRINRPRSRLRHHHAPHRSSRRRRRRLHHRLWRRRSCNLGSRRRSRNFGCCHRRSRNHGLSRRRSHHHGRSSRWRSSLDHRSNRRSHHHGSCSSLHRSRRRMGRWRMRRWRRNHHWWLHNHRAQRRLTRNRRRWRSHHNRRALPRQRDHPSRGRSSRSRHHGRTRRLHHRLRCRCRNGRRCSRGPRYSHSRTAARIRFRLLPRQDRLHRVARLGDVREIERGLRLYGRPRTRAAPAPLVLEVVAHLLGLIGLNRTRVRLRLSHANCRQSVQNGPALDFHFACEIVDSNFAHPSLFSSPARLAAHRSASSK